MIVVNFLAVVIIGYLLGSIPSGLLIGKWLGKVDIRAFGSGKTGTTNVLRVAGRKAAAMVVILDILMPKLTGFEVIEAAKLVRPDIIYIAYSADVISLNKIKCEKLGFHACITKPALPSRLLNTLDEVLVLRGQLT